MRQSFRITDNLFRYGGEEFLVLIGPLTKEVAIEVFDRFRQDVEQYQFGRLDKVTVSIGMCEIRSQDEPTQIVGQADQAMYHAKATGRNRLVVFDDLLAAGSVVSPELNCEAEIFRKATPVMTS